MTRQHSHRAGGPGRVGAAAALAALLFLAPGCMGGQKPLVDDQRTEMDAGERATVPFHLDFKRAVRYETESRNDAPYDLCIIKRSEAAFWMDGDRSYAQACREGVRSASGRVELAAGEWAVAYECRLLVGSCVLSTTVVPE